MLPRTLPIPFEIRAYSQVFYALPQHFRQMLRFPSGDVLDLLAAGNSGSDDLDVWIGGANRRRKPAIGDREREIVVILFRSQKTRHMAPTGNSLRESLAIQFKFVIANF
jgi:hypothetical protein